jgi:putative hydrolase of the HAD superfamily
MIFDGQHIDSIIFDLGGVILNIDYQLPVKAFKRLGLDNFQQQFSQASQQHVFDDYETGKISSEVFLERVKNLLPPDVPLSAIIDAWNSILLDLPEERLHLLEKAAAAHRIFLLSNTNDLHIRSFNSYLSRSFGLPAIDQLFEKAYLSYRMGLRKPDPAIFNFVLEDAGLDPASTLFIDDSIQHIDSAISCGINSYHLVNQDLVSFLADRL